MVRSRAVTIIVAILAAAGTLPQWSHGSTLEKIQADNSSTSSHVDIETVNAIVAAINQSILEFRATSVQLSARLEHVEKTVMDIAPGNLNAFNHVKKCEIRSYNSYCILQTPHPEFLWQPIKPSRLSHGARMMP